MRISHRIKQERKKLRRLLKRQRKSKNYVRDYRLYALSLANGYYYVGMTAYKDVTRRFNQHIGGKDTGGAKWTSIHTPIAVIEVRELGKTSKEYAELQETLMTIEYIEKYGLDRVRGGELCTTSLYLTSVRYTAIKEREKYRQSGTVRIIRERVPMVKPTATQGPQPKNFIKKSWMPKREWHEFNYQVEIGTKIRDMLGDE